MNNYKKIGRKFWAALFMVITQSVIFMTGCASPQNKNIAERADSCQIKITTDTAITSEAGKIERVVVPEPYNSFLKSMYSDLVHKETVVCFDERDIDQDGLNEAVIGLGATSDEIDSVLVLRNDHNKIKFVAGTIVDAASPCFDLKLVQMQGEKQYCIYSRLTKGSDDLEGFLLFKMINNKLINIESSYAPDAGIDSLTDVDHDGKYDGYFSSRWNDDVYRYPIEIQYAYQNGSFTLSEAHIDLSQPYPDSIKQVVLDFISLKLLSNRFNCNDVRQRLQDLCSDNELLATQWKENAWYDVWHAMWMDIDEENNPLQVKQNGEQAIAKISYGTKKEPKQLLLQLSCIDKKWKIIGAADAK